MIPSINSDIKLWRGIWRTWHTLPDRLTSAVVGFDGIKHDFDLDEWDSAQVVILEGVLKKMGQGVLISYHEDSIKEIGKHELKALDAIKYYDILWAHWLPIVARRREYIISNHLDLQVLVKSNAWVEYADAFILFANNIDNEFITRFVHKSWKEQDQFIAIAPIDGYPSWMVIANHLHRNNLEEMLMSLVAKLVFGAKLKNNVERLT